MSSSFVITTSLSACRRCGPDPMATSPPRRRGCSQLVPWRVLPAGRVPWSGGRRLGEFVGVGAGVDGVQHGQLRVVDRPIGEVEGVGRVGFGPVRVVGGVLASSCRVRLSILAWMSSILAAASAFICAHLPRARSAVWSARCCARCWASLASCWAWSIRCLSWSRDSVAAACTAALVAATRCWSSSTRAEKSMFPPWVAPISV